MKNNLLLLTFILVATSTPHHLHGFFGHAIYLFFSQQQLGEQLQKRRMSHPKTTEVKSQSGSFRDLTDSPDIRHKKK